MQDWILDVFSIPAVGRNTYFLMQKSFLFQKNNVDDLTATCMPLKKFNTNSMFL